ncbi:MAG: hypothetical protein LBF16_04415, partial [Pseudomonadales bacterium]|nr:hypothetical protein [Pseudomonadales bacterium]
MSLDKQISLDEWIKCQMPIKNSKKFFQQISKPFNSNILCNWEEYIFWFGLYIASFGDMQLISFILATDDLFASLTKPRREL